MTMLLKLKRLFALVIILACLFGYSKANASVRIAVLNAAPVDEEQIGKMNNNVSASEIKKMIALQKKYMGLFISVVSRTGAFDTIDLDQENVNKLFSGRSSALMSLMRKAQEDPTLYYRELGHMAGVRYFINGVVIFKKLSNEISANAQFTLIDAMNGEMVQQFTGTGISMLSSASTKSSSAKTERKSTKAKSSSKPKKDSKSVSSDNNEDSVREQAAIYAMSQVSEYMHRYIAGESSMVTNIENGNIILNRGASFGIKTGDIYKVQVEAQEAMEDVFGSTSDTPQITDTALIRIKDVQNNTSTAEVIANAGNINAIQVGDKVILLSGLEAEKILADISSGTRQPFPSQHPVNKRAEINRPSSEQKNVVRESVSEIQQIQPGIIRIGVLKFGSKVGNIADKDASAITDLFTRFLASSGKIAVIERDRIEAIAREHRLNLSGMIAPSTAAQIGKLASCKYILRGAITEAQEDESSSGSLITPRRYNTNPNIYNTKAGQVLAGLELLGMIIDAVQEQKDNVVTETYEMTAAIDVQLIDVETSSIVMAFVEQGSATQSTVLTQDKDGYTKGVEVDYGGLQSRAIASATANLSHKLRGALTGEYTQISSVNDGEIIINRGASSGVQIGDLFCIYPEGKSASDTEAIISVKDVQDAFSTAEVVKSITNSYSPAIGSRLEPVLYKDFQKGIWHVKNHKRRTAHNKQDTSLEDLADNSRARRRLETSSTDAKKVIKSYGLKAQAEKALIDAHAKAAKMNNTKKKYEAYASLSEANANDYLASYNAGRYAFELKFYTQAREWAEKSLYINPDYKPAQALVEKIDGGK